MGLTKSSYIVLLADLLNRASPLKERERRVREANRALYRATVDPRGTDTEADLALAKAATAELLRQGHQQEGE